MLPGRCRHGCNPPPPRRREEVEVEKDWGLPPSPLLPRDIEL